MIWRMGFGDPDPNSVCPWVSYLISLSHSVLIGKTGMIAVPISYRVDASVNELI